jgi:hypothetical protein
MVLPVNMESGSDYIAKMSQARANDAQAQYTSAKTDQQMAENREWLSQTQKEMRAAKAKSETYQAQAESIKNQVILDNPDLYRQVLESGMGAQLQQHMASKGQAYNERVTNIFGPGISGKTPEEAVEDYRGKYANALKIDPGIVEGLPTLEQVEKDPTQISRINMMVGTAWENNSKYLQAAGEANIKAKADMFKEVYKQGKLDERETYKQDQAMGREVYKGEVKFGMEGVRQGNRMSLQGLKGTQRLEQIEKQGYFRLKAAAMSKKDKAKDPVLSAVGLATPGNYMTNMVLPAMKGLGLSKEDTDDYSRANMATDMFARTQQIYMDEFNAHQVDPAHNPPARAPAEVTKSLIQDAIADGQLSDEGTFGKKWVYHKAGSDEHITAWISGQKVSARDKIAMRKVVTKLKQNKEFDKLGWDEKKDLIESGMAMKHNVKLPQTTNPMNSTQPTAIMAGGSSSEDEEEAEEIEDDEDD